MGKRGERQTDRQTAVELLTGRKKNGSLTDELVVLSLLDVHTDIHAGDLVVGEDVVLGGAVVPGDVGRVAPFVRVKTV